jgi:hypothetical protein
MWYPILFVVIGVVIIAFGRIIAVMSDRPPGRENVEGIKTGIVISVIGLIVAAISLMVLAGRVGDVFR